MSPSHPPRRRRRPKLSAPIHESSNQHTHTHTTHEYPKTSQIKYWLEVTVRRPQCCFHGRSNEMKTLWLLDIITLMDILCGVCVCVVRVCVCVVRVCVSVCIYRYARPPLHSPKEETVDISVLLGRSRKKAAQQGHPSSTHTTRTQHENPSASRSRPSSLSTYLRKATTIQTKRDLEIRP